MSDRGCELHEIWPAEKCVVCSGKLTAERAEEKLVDYYFTAGFDSRLACGHWAETGDRLARMKNDTIICEECAA